MSNEPTTIGDVEAIIETSLETLRGAPLDPKITAAFQYLTPEGYRVRAQLEEDGRKKRSSAAATNWQPDRCEVVLYFEPIADKSLATSTEKKEVKESSVAATLPNEPGTLPDDVTDLQVHECCNALAEAEKAGKAFIALKWFRDEALPKFSFDWLSTPESRQKVLAKAIENGAIETSRRPNPKAPLHPTTTVTLARTATPVQALSRFKPIVVRGEPVSVSLMRDRGRF